MTAASVPTLLLIAVAAVVAPVLADGSGRLLVPSTVIEILLGILIGPAVLGLAHPGNAVVAGLSDIGLTFLMFMAGFEMDLQRVKGRPLTLGVLGWVMSLALGLSVAFALRSGHVVLDTVVTGLALTTTAIGTLLPMLRDSGALETTFGAMALGAGSIGEVGPLVCIALLLDHKDPRITGVLLIAFVLVAASAVALAVRRKPLPIVAALHRHLHSSSQLPVRVSMLVVLLLVYLAYELGLDVLLGAFAAGIAIRQFTAGEGSAEVTSKLEGIGYGFLVPIFFVVSGMRFDLRALLVGPGPWLRLLLFLVAFLLVRGAPALILYRRDLPASLRTPLALLSATGLPVVVVITTIGISEGRMRPVTAAALVGAGMLSVLIFPVLGLQKVRAAHRDLREGTDAAPASEPR